MESYDAVIIGAGHNGLAAGVILADAGWSVVVLERNDRPGGAVRTEEVTLPGFRHDLMAMNLNLFAGSRFFERYGGRLREGGFDLVPSSHPVCSVFPDGSHVGISTDLDETLSSISALSAADVGSYRALFDRFAETAPHLFPLLGVPMPSIAAARTLFSGFRALGRGWPLELGRLVLQSSREFAADHFESPEVAALIATWGMHLDFPPDVPGGALFPYLETMAAQANGMAIGKGGAFSMVEGLTNLLRNLGGEVRYGAEVDGVTVKSGAATSVTVKGERFAAERAVIANVVPNILFGSLVPDDQVPAEFRSKVRRYRYAPGTMMVHLALSDPPDWEAGSAAGRSAYVHVGGYMDDMSRAYGEAVAGLLPRLPTLVVGQPTIVDASRAPNGRHVLWIQVRMVPPRIRADAAGEIDATEWAEAKEPLADRVMAILEVHAPGIGPRVLARHVMSPEDLEALNPNLVGGDQLSGSHHPMQFFLFRPFPGWSRYTTPIDRLYMCGAATWPGAGVGAGSGTLLGERLTTSRLARFRR
ncbi:MAG TPA: NAD(P)/FAD-dependent oxidoreductase [Acidimicrobiia bacterium]|nr:NAD(P)/FAD-dependent oxidoreductase [Acidimicrobiia bacterium]